MKLFHIFYSEYNIEYVTTCSLNFEIYIYVKDKKLSFNACTKLLTRKLPLSPRKDSKSAISQFLYTPRSVRSQVRLSNLKLYSKSIWVCDCDEKNASSWKIASNNSINRWIYIEWISVQIEKRKINKIIGKLCKTKPNWVRLCFFSIFYIFFFQIDDKKSVWIKNDEYI